MNQGLLLVSDCNSAILRDHPTLWCVRSLHLTLRIQQNFQPMKIEKLNAGSATGFWWYRGVAGVRQDNGIATLLPFCDVILYKDTQIVEKMSICRILLHSQLIQCKSNFKQLKICCNFSIRFRIISILNRQFWSYLHSISESMLLLSVQKQFCFSLMALSERVMCKLKIL